MLFFTYAMAWIGVFLGLVVPTVEVAQQLGFLVIFPLTFLSNAFVPTETLPGVLQPIAEWNPVSALTGATRELFGNPNPYVRLVPGRAPDLLSIVWTFVLLAFRPARDPPVPRDRPLTAAPRRIAHSGYDRLAWISTSRPSRSCSATPSARSRVERVAPVAEELDREARFPSSSSRDGRARADGNPVPRGLGGAGGDTLSYAIAIEELAAHRLVRRDHGRRAHLARHDADLPLRLRRAEGAVAPGTSPAASGSPRSGSPSRTRARTQARPARRRRCATAPGSSTARRCSSRTPGTEHHVGRDDHRAHGRRRDLEPRRRERHARLRDLGADPQDRLEGLRHARALVRRLRGPGGEPARHARRGIHQFLEILDGGRISVAAMGVGLAQGAYDLAYALRAGAAAVRAADLRPSRRSSSSSPTWRPRSRRHAASS